MDPNLFHIDWEQFLEVLSVVIVLSFVIERALAIVFEHRLYLKYLGQLDIKELIAFGLSFFVCAHWQFDIVAVLLRGDSTSLAGEAITAAVIAGGSKASIKLFHDVLDTKSTAMEQYQLTGKVK